MATDDRYPQGAVPASEIAEPVAALPFPAIHYPESDGQPLGETETHRDETVDLIQSLADYFRDDPEVYVGGDLFLYYEEGNPRAVVAPDVFVVRGVPKLVTRDGKPEKRRIYRLWEEGRAPSTVIEVTSEHTRDEDAGRKLERYAGLGVEEVFLYDPLGEYLNPRLQGHRLIDRRYRRMQPAADGSLHSRALGITLAFEDGRLRLRETATGEPLLRFDDLRVRAAAEAAARRQAEERAEALEAELTRLRRQLARREGD
jgi:Uma2 family endonuclease